MFLGFLRKLSVFFIFFSAFGSCWLDAADSLSNSLLPPSGWRLGNRALFARTNEPCGTTIDDPDTPECRPLCSGSGSCAGQPNKKRDLLPRIQADNSTDVLPREASKLAKRVFEILTQDELVRYSQEQADDAIPLIPPPEPNQVQANVVVQQVFGNAPIKIGTAGLCGCTVVTVVSNQAVYMGHFFENPTWTNAEAFQNSVLNFFTAGANPVGTGLVIDSTLFPVQPSTRVYIMTPRPKPRKGAGNPNRSNYVGKVPKLRDQIEAILGAGVTFVTYNYLPINCKSNKLFANQKGVALFEFDPNSDGANNPGWRLFYEHHVFRNTDGQGNPNAPAYDGTAAIGIPD